MGGRTAQTIEKLADGILSLSIALRCTDCGKSASDYFGELSDMVHSHF